MKADEERRPRWTNGQVGSLVSIIALLFGSSGAGTAWYALQGGHRYTQQEADVQNEVMSAKVIHLQAQVAELREEIRDLDRGLQKFAISGPSEVRSKLDEIMRRLDALPRNPQR